MENLFSRSRGVVIAIIIGIIALVIGVSALLKSGSTDQYQGYLKKIDQQTEELKQEKVDR
jgi:uncharacterized protein YxeA